MSRLIFALFVLCTVLLSGHCQEDDDNEPETEITDTDVVRAVVEVCQPRHHKRHTHVLFFCIIRTIKASIF